MYYEFVINGSVSLRQYAESLKRTMSVAHSASVADVCHSGALACKKVTSYTQ